MAVLPPRQYLRDDSTFVFLTDADIWNALFPGASPGVPSIPLPAGPPFIRELLLANRDYYVDFNAGSDTNDGRTPATPFKHVQKGIDTAVMVDQGSFGTNINVADATYPENLLLKSYIGNGPITILGSAGMPATDHFVIDGGAGASSVGGSGVLGDWVLSGLQLQCAGGSGILVDVASRLRYKNIKFKTCGVACIQAQNTGTVVTNAQRDGTFGSVECIGTFTSFINTDQSATVRMVLGTITLTGTPTFTTFVIAADGAGIYLVSNTISGGIAAGCKKYDASMNAWIQTFGATLPGTVAGTTSLGGQYN